MPVLFIELAPRAGLAHRSEPGGVIGRASWCDVRLADPTVSRTHARVWTTGATWGVEDLGSRSGVFVNDRRCRGSAAARRGDVLRIGCTRLLLTGHRP